ncbi:MAG: hypothetical protein HY381_02305 [Candidatus Chisholmbacteria bacterium]|nr:hypothetical protein [Candidatus Chisholmbacteria bacterium]
MTDGEKQNGGGTSWVMAAVVALIVAGGGGTYYFYNQYQQTQRELQEARAAATSGQNQAVVQETVTKVGELMELPADETPTVATIRDTEQLKDHPFLAKGQKDDRLLIYTGAKVVVMYRPSTNKIVAVGTVTIQQQEEGGGGATPTETPAATP